MPTVTSEHTAQTPAALTIEVYTTPMRSFTSAAKSEGPGDVPTWSPTSATLIYGDHDAILVDTLATYDQVDALADWIDKKGRAAVAHLHHPPPWGPLARSGPFDAAVSGSDGPGHRGGARPRGIRGCRAPPSPGP